MFEDDSSKRCVDVLLKEEKVQAQTTSGSVLEFALAEVEVWVDGRRYQVEAAIADELAVPVLLGEDLPLEELILDNNYRTGKDEGSNYEEVLEI